MNKAPAYRLPTHVHPRRYHVELRAGPEQGDFDGRVTMELTVDEACDHIEMHARDLEIHEALLTTATAELTLETELLGPQQAVRFSSPETIEAGQVKLQARFSGRLSTNMHGLYLATDGHSRAVCTQCEATDARAIFPCFDEPAFKAELQWTITAPSDLVALANGAQSGVSEADGQKTWSFEATPPVSSYLAALVIGDFEGSATRVANDTPMQVWATRGKVDQTGFALDYTEKLLPWYESYFDIAYPYGKYDQVAVPGFDAGAMENVGLVLFRQNLLLMDPATASWRQEKLIAKVIAHEFAHMWFGNLVTMQWWDDLWLNEAFAEWMAHKACDAITPDYKVWNDFQADKNRALVDDALPTTHPIWAPVETPDEALEMFDVITYQKGCAVMRMLENFLGEDSFRDGIRAYMKAFAASNARGADLWRHLEAASGQPVGALMKSWIAVPGFPVISASLDGTTLRLSQRRFFSRAGSDDVPGDWNVPVVVRYEDAGQVRTHKFIMTDATHEETLPAEGEVRWVYPNADEIGFYRCQLDDQLAGALLQHGLTKLTSSELMGLLEDHWALVRNATLDIDRFVDLLQAYAKAGATADHNVLGAMVDRLGTIDHLLEDSGEAGAIEAARAWIADMLQGDLDQLGHTSREGESQNDGQRRAQLLHALGKLARVAPVIEACRELAAAEREDPAAVDPNLAGTALNVTATNGDEDTHASWVDTYNQRKAAGAAPQNMLRYLYTLASFRPEALTRKTLGLIADETIPQEAVGPVLGQLLAQRHAQDVAYDHLKTEWDALRSRVGDMSISRVVEAVGALRHHHREDVVKFFEAHPPTGAERALARALERMDQAHELRTRVTPSLLARFSGS